MPIYSMLDVVAGPTGELLLHVTVAVHVAGGVVAAVAGATAGLVAKRPWRHPGAGTVYRAALAVVVGTAAPLVLSSPAPRWGLLALAVVSWAAARAGVLVHRSGVRHRRTVHVLGMRTSYVGLLTGFYVDNGPRLPGWDRLPAAWFWFLPGLLAAPVVARAVLRCRARVDLAPRSARR